MIKSVIGLDRSPLTAGFKAAEGDVSHFVGTAKNQLQALAAVAGIGFGAAEAVGAFKNLATELDGVAKSSKRLGVSTDVFQAMAYGAKLEGAEVQDLERSIQLLKRQMQEAMTGPANNDAALMFGRLGLSVKELQNLSPDQLLAKVAQGFGNLTSENERSTMAMEIFGRSGTKLIPMLATMEDLQKEFKATGRLISEDAIKAAEAYNDALERLAFTMKALAANSGLMGKAQGWAEGAEAWALGQNKIAASKGVITRDTAMQDTRSQVEADVKTNPELQKQIQEMAKRYADRSASMKPASAYTGVATMQVTNAEINKRMSDQGFKPGVEFVTPKTSTGDIDTANAKKKAEAEEKIESADCRQAALDAKASDKVAETVKQLEAKAALSEAKSNSSDQSDASVLHAEQAEVVRRLELEINRTLKDSEKAAIGIAYARQLAAAAAEKEKKFRDAISEKGSGIRYDALEKLGFGDSAARMKMVDEMTKSKGGALTTDEEQKASALGSAQYQLAHVSDNRPELRQEYLTNDLARIGGFTNSVVKADVDGINRQILEENKATNNLLDRIEQLLAGGLKSQ